MVLSIPYFFCIFARFKYTSLCTKHFVYEKTTTATNGLHAQCSYRNGWSR